MRRSCSRRPPRLLRKASRRVLRRDRRLLLRHGPRLRQLRPLLPRRARLHQPRARHRLHRQPLLRPLAPSRRLRHVRRHLRRPRLHHRVRHLRLLRRLVRRLPLLLRRLAPNRQRRRRHLLLPAPSAARHRPARSAANARTVSAASPVRVRRRRPRHLLRRPRHSLQRRRLLVRLLRQLQPQQHLQRRRRRQPLLRLPQLQLHRRPRRPVRRHLAAPVVRKAAKAAVVAKAGRVRPARQRPVRLPLLARRPLQPLPALHRRRRPLRQPPRLRLRHRVQHLSWSRPAVVTSRSCSRRHRR